MHPKLAWIQSLQETLTGAMGASVVVTVEDHVDPLKKLVVLSFAEELRKGEYVPVQNLAHGFAKANDCVLERIRRRTPKALVLEVLVKTRLGPIRDKNPL